jgi:uncharacterized protein (TIGR02246 family)
VHALGWSLSAFLVLCTTAIGQGSEPAARTADREAVVQILRSWEDAWNTHDMHAFAELFHDDAVWILWTGQVWTGRTAIEEGHAAVHKTYFRNSMQRETLDELTFVGPDAAVVRFLSTLTGDERWPDKAIRSRKLLIVTRREAKWKVGWGQNTRFAEDMPAKIPPPQ